MISVRFQGKPFNITVIQVYAPTSNTEEAEVEQFYEDLQDLELKPVTMAIIKIYKETVVHINYGILLSYKKEHIWVSSNDVDEARAHYTEWSKSERER